jgi:hypothetical protein
LNDDWGSRRDEIELQAGECEAAIGATFEIFGQDAFRKWDGRKFESRLNRAVFDIMTYYFSVKGTREAAVQNCQAVKEAFQRICTENPGFRKTLESTTKSLDATRTRFMAWGSELNEVLHLRIRLPLIGV